MQIGTISGMAVSLIGQPMVTDDGSGAITPYTKAPPTAPSNGIPNN